MAQLAVVHVHRPLPGDLLGVNAQGVALLDMVVQHCGQQVVCRADGVEVAGKVQVNVLHGHHLGVSAAGSPALDAEHRAQRGLAQGGDGVFADLPQAVGQAHGGGGLALARRGGGDGGDKDQLSVGLIRHVTQKGVVDLGLVVAVGLPVFFVHAGRFGDLADSLHLTALGNFNIAEPFHGDLLLLFEIFDR